MTDSHALTLEMLSHLKRPCSFFTWLGRYSGIFSLMIASDNSRPMYSANPGYDAEAMAEVKGEDGAADEGYKEAGAEGCIELDCDDV